MVNWVAFQLSERGENVIEEEPELIEKIIKKYVSSNYFLPLHFNKSKSYENKIFLFRGYVFIEFNEKEIRKYSELAATPYFVGPLLVNGKFCLIRNDEIKKLKIQLVKITKPVIKVGDKVRVLDGKYKNLKAVVTEYYKKDKEADLSINLKCMNILVPRIPITCLKNLSSEEKVKNNLMHKILNLLKNYSTGLTRKQILENIEFSKEEKKRVSTCLARAIKRKLIKVSTNKKRKSVFKYIDK